MKAKFYKFLLIFIAGMLGVISLLFADIPIPDEVKAQLLTVVSEDLMMLFLLINPTILLLVSTLIGVNMQVKTELKTPVFDSLLSRDYSKVSWSILSYGVVGGILAGALIVLFTKFITPFIPEIIQRLQENLDLPVITRFLYGGITEEILLRYGLMTLMVWLFARFIKSAAAYWMAIILSSVIFGIGHLPAVYAAVDAVDFTLQAYIIIGNSIGGVFFGWLYWKKGLESAMIAHIFTHVVMLLIM